MKHPAIIASIILAAGLVLSSVLISSSINTLATEVRQKPVPSLSMPSELAIRSASPIRLMTENYKARELAFVVDWVDAQFIGWCTRKGHPHFFSLSHYVLLLASGIVLWRISRAHLDLPPVVAAGLVLLLWSSPTAQLYSSFYR